MAFPITVDAALSSAEQPGKYGPFLSNGARYQIILRLTQPSGGPFSANLVLEQSTDNGNTWAELDAADEPLINWNGPGTYVPYTCAQAGTTLYVVFYDISTGYTLVSFDTLTGLWGTSTPISPAPPNVPISGEGSYFLYQLSLAYSPFDNTLLLIVPADSISGLGSVSHTICAYTRYNVAGESWGVWADLGFEDYGNITTWNQVPCGIAVNQGDGSALVLMQQVTVAGPGQQHQFFENVAGSGSFTVPDDADTSAVVEVTGAGAGGSADTGAGSGGGGGGFSEATIGWAPGDVIAYTVGAGGLPVQDGGDSSFGATSANGGKAGVDQTTGGVGGTGDTFDGADGGDAGTFTGGGGGGVGSDAGAPTAGQTGQSGAGGNGGVLGGGNGGDLNFYGLPGGNGGGAGGNGNGVTPDNTQPAGGDGVVQATWNSVRNTNPCRLWQQVIGADGTLGALQEITQGEYPALAQGVEELVPMAFDVTISGSKVAITFTGATSTTGNNNIVIGQGVMNSTAPVAFSFQSISSGNGGNGWNAQPCLAYGTAGLYCSFISAPTGQAVSFSYSLNSGGGFGSVVAFGVLSSGDVHAGSRLQSNTLVAAPEYVWGTPTSQVIDYTVNE